MGAADLPSSSERTSFFDAQATHRTSARAWSAASAVLILGLGSVYGFFMLLVVSFYGLLFLGLFPKWLTAPLAAAGLTDNLPPGLVLMDRRNSSRRRSGRSHSVGSGNGNSRRD